MINAEAKSQKSGVRSQKIISILDFRITNLKSQIILLFTVLCPLFTVFYGCTTLKGPAILAPMPPLSPEYNNSGHKMAFATKDVKISLLPLNPSETKKALTMKDANNPLAEILSANQYLVFIMDIENLSKSKLMYNPSLTTLFDNNMDVRKPLDYTDLYSLAGNLSDVDFVLSRMKDMFYDIAITLEPGQKTSRLLLFPGIDEKANEMTIIMKEIYIGTSTIAVSFGFKVAE
ncbi:MAG: hypothetical protein HZB80_09495 [Deltaproteobacteria bacterium]|nr:hypothetical protein [Deltaproteobacteria bacterium]